MRNHSLLLRECDSFFFSLLLNNQFHTCLAHKKAKKMTSNPDASFLLVSGSPGSILRSNRAFTPIYNVSYYYCAFQDTCAF